MSAYEIGLRAMAGGVLFHPFHEKYLDAVHKETEFSEGMRLPALPLYEHLVQSGDRAFQSLCRTALWLKRKIKDKDTSKADRRRLDNTLSLVEFNIDGRKHRAALAVGAQFVADGGLGSPRLANSFPTRVVMRSMTGCSNCSEIAKAAPVKS